MINIIENYRYCKVFFAFFSCFLLQAGFRSRMSIQRVPIQAIARSWLRNLYTSRVPFVHFCCVFHSNRHLPPLKLHSAQITICCCINRHQLLCQLCIIAFCGASTSLSHRGRGRFHTVCKHGNEGLGVFLHNRVSTPLSHRGRGCFHTVCKRGTRENTPGSHAPRLCENQFYELPE